MKSTKREIRATFSLSNLRDISTVRRILILILSRRRARVSSTGFFLFFFFFTNNDRATLWLCRCWWHDLTKVNENLAILEKQFLESCPASSQRCFNRPRHDINSFSVVAPVSRRFHGSFRAARWSNTDRVIAIALDRRKKKGRWIERGKREGQALCDVKRG